MKKFLLFAVMALVSTTMSAQIKSKSAAPAKGAQTKQMVVGQPATQKKMQAVAPKANLPISVSALNKKLTLDANRLQPVERAARSAKAVMPQGGKAFRAHDSKKAPRQLKNLKPMVNTKAAPRKAPAFAASYTGKGTNYYTGEDLEWTMSPGVATFEGEDGSTEDVDILIDIIPLYGNLQNALAEIYPDGFPVEYSVEDNTITIQPQAIASYTNEAEDSVFYITVFSANSDNEDGTITMTVADDGLLKVVDGNWIALGEFANTPFDEEFGEAFRGNYEMVSYVRYIYEGQKDGITIEKEYNAHGVDIAAYAPVNWTLQQGTYTEDGEDTPIFVNMSPLDDMFTGIYPDGIDVMYSQEGNVITVEPQVIASMSNDDGSREYLMLFSGTSDDGCIVLTVGDDGSLNTIDDESVMIGGWTTNKFDPTFETYEGYYTYTDRVIYMLPNAKPVAPADVAFEPEELVLFAGLGNSGYSFNNNLGVLGAYAPTTFRNATFDIATGFEWSATEIGEDDQETVITGNDTNFTLNTKGGAIYEDITLVGINQTERSDAFTWGYGHAPTSDGTGIQYEAAYYYAGQGASAFQFSDGTAANMTRQNPDGDLTFYTNWGTPDKYESASISTIYSYQGKPAAPLYITGVTLPLVGFEAKDNFNLHIKLCKCVRSASGRLTVGDVIAESDAAAENIDDKYDSGITAIVFNELYVEDEMGMSETLDYLFIEDEFVIIIEGWDNGTFSGVLGSQDITDGQFTSTWFESTGQEGRLRSYSTWTPQLFISLNDATYGYLHTEDNTNLTFAPEGGEATIHVDPMYYNIDEDTEEPTYSLYVDNITVDGEDAEEVPEWLTIEVANEDYTTATEVDEDGEEYTYFVNGIDYDLVFKAEAMPADVLSRSVEIRFMQTGALLTVKVTQDSAQGIATVVKKDVKNSRTFNLAGQNVKNAKGIVVRDGKKLIVK